jgi:hypothetical protein
MRILMAAAMKPIRKPHKIKNPGGEMNMPVRVTISFDEETAELFKNLKKNMGISQSELMRESLKFFGKHKMLFEFFDETAIYAYSEMLSTSEHIIIDIDHWKLFLNFIETHPDNEKFWSIHREVCHSHANHFKHHLFNAESILKRFEICNLFNLRKTGINEFTLIFSSDLPKKFMRIKLEEVFKGVGFVVEIKDEFSRLRVRVIEDL